MKMVRTEHEYLKMFKTTAADDAAEETARRPVSRVLSPPCGVGRPFLWGPPRGAPHATNPGDRAEMPLRHPSRLAPGRTRRPPLFGLAPGGVCPAAPVARGAVRSYRPVSPLPAGNWGPCAGGLFSVALSLGSPPPAVSRHRIPVEPGLSSSNAVRPTPPAVVQPSGKSSDARGCRQRQVPIRPAVRDDRRGRNRSALHALPPAQSLPRCRTAPDACRHRHNP